MSHKKPHVRCRGFRLGGAIGSIILSRIYALNTIRHTTMVLVKFARIGGLSRRYGAGGIGIGARLSLPPLICRGSGSGIL